MKFKRRRREDVAIELTPLIDVVFLLLIFFMVSTTFIRENQLKIDLPEAAGDLQERDETVELTITASGEYAVNERLLVNGEIQTILRALREVSAGDLSKRLIITADASAPYQSVVRAMDAAGQIGMTRISLTTQSPQDEG